MSIYMGNKYAKMLSLKEISGIPLIQLVENRKLQKDVHYSIVKHEIENRVNRIILNRTDRDCHYSTNTGCFRLNKDRNNIYFFGNGYEISETLPHLEEKDLIESGFCSRSGDLLMFTEQLSRVEKKGGIPKGYNSIKKEWQSFSNSIYTSASIGEKIVSWIDEKFYSKFYFSK